MTGVEIMPHSPTRSSLDLVPSAYELAEKIARTDFVPAALRGKPEAVLAAILTGHELGIGPMQSLAKIHVIEGRPAMSAELMRALVLAAGHDIWVDESNATRCKVSATRSGSARVSSFTWSMDDAKRAGLDGRQNWRKYPRAMLLARATSEAIRAVFPDVVAGVSYSVEELTDGDFLEADEGATAAPAAPSRKRRARTAATAAPAPVEAAEATPAVELPPLPGEDDEVSGESAAPLPDGEQRAGSVIDDAPDPAPPPDDDEQDDEDGGTLPLQSRIAMWCTEVGLDADGRHRFLAALTDGRIRSSKDVPLDMVAGLRAALVRLKRGELRLDGERLIDVATALPSSDPAGEHQRGRAATPKWSAMTVPQLVAACRERDIEPAGSKADLIALLEGADA